MQYAATSSCATRRSGALIDSSSARTPKEKNPIGSSHQALLARRRQSKTEGLSMFQALLNVTFLHRTKPEASLRLRGSCSGPVGSRCHEGAAFQSSCDAPPPRTSIPRGCGFSETLEPVVVKRTDSHPAIQMSRNWVSTAGTAPINHEGHE